MKREIEIGFVALLEAYEEMEYAETGGPEEYREAALKMGERMNALQELAGVDTDLPGPPESEGPLINWLWDKAADSTSTG